MGGWLLKTGISGPLTKKKYCIWLSLWLSSSKEIIKEIRKKWRKKP
jgi:hypothetical protein